MISATAQTRWGGADIKELSTRLTASDIKYTLRRDIKLILRCSASTRYPAHLDFVVNTVAASSADTQLSLLAIDFLHTSPPETQRLQLDNHVPDTVINQWKSWAADRVNHSDDRVGDADLQQSQSPDSSGNIPERTVADSSTGTVPPQLPLNLPSPGSSFLGAIQSRRWCCRTKTTVAIAV